MSQQDQQKTASTIFMDLIRRTWTFGSKADHHLLSWLDAVHSLRLQCTFSRPIKKYLNPLAFEPSIA